MAAPEYRIGSGWDSHLFLPGHPLWLGGVRVPNADGLAGHSDGDVLLHALCDALLGAIASGDIGSHFPSSDPRWHNASSSQFVHHALQLVHTAGFRIVNLDATLILNRPHLQPLRVQLCQSLAQILELDLDRISIKAKTPEGLATPDTAIAQVTLLLCRA